MSTPDDTDNSPEQALSNRIRNINDATGGLYAAIIKLSMTAEGQPMPLEGKDALGHALTLVNCGVIALTEIADAQQRMVALAERDIAAEIAAAVDDAAEVKAAVKVAETTKRSFIGQKKNSG